MPSIKVKYKPVAPGYRWGLRREEMVWENEAKPEYNSEANPSFKASPVPNLSLAAEVYRVAAAIGDLEKCSRDR